MEKRYLFVAKGYEELYEKLLEELPCMQFLESVTWGSWYCKQNQKNEQDEKVSNQDGEDSRA